MAPEVLKDPTASRTIKYDVYSFGILLWILLSGKKPFESGIVVHVLFVHLSALDLLCIFVTHLMLAQKPLRLSANSRIVSSSVLH